MRRLDEVSRSPRHVLGLLRYLVGERGRLAASYKYVAHSPDHASTVLHETAFGSERIAEAESRTEMLRELRAAFLDAAERVRREEHWGALYAQHAADEGDNSFAEASALEAGSRWHQTS